jgi:hypothetical protein
MATCRSMAMAGRRFVVAARFRRIVWTVASSKND